MSVIHIFSKTDDGKKRKHNEDSIRTMHVKTGGLKGESEFWALVLADGMGGYDKGEVASTMTCDELAKFSIVDLPPVFGDTDDPDEVLAVFQDGVAEKVDEINHSIWELGSGGKMGCTLVYAIIFKDNLYLAYCGDSRAYMMKGNTLEQISVDHSYVNALLANNAITKEEAADHPMRHVITKSIGTNEKVKADFKQLPFEKNAYLLMCSDGLTDMVSDEEIENIMNNNNPPQICQKLVDTANENGGKDNISVILARVTPGKAKRPARR